MSENGAVKRTRIALVEAGTPATHVYSRAYLPRVGIPTMGAILADLGYSCDLFFQSLPGFRREDLFAYDIVGIGSLSNTIEEAYRLADTLKQTGKTVVMGGPHVSFMPEEALTHCDYVVIGEGENTMAGLMQALAQNRPAADVPGLAFRLDNGTVHFTSKAQHVEVQDLPSPDFSLSPQIRNGDIPPIITTSRGCPHDCSFCCVTALFGRRYRFRSEDQVIKDLRPVQHRSVCFGDDNFCANPKRTKDLLRRMIAEQAVPLRWSGQMTVKAGLDEELLRLMQQTRCRIMYIGIESINPDTLTEFGKAHTVDATTRCIANLHAHQIGIHGMFVIGPDDHPDTARQIVDYAIATDIDTIQICSLTPFPGTAAYVQYEKHLLHHEWRYFEGMHVVVEPLHTSAFEMQKALIEQMQRFYSLGRILSAYRPGRAWRTHYRLGGHLLMRRWVNENAGYLKGLKNHQPSRPRLGMHAVG